ncbi:MAG TPA: tetratricopeptide repeat protein [Gallionellaceae bacterium]
MNRYTNIGEAVVTTTLTGKARVRVAQSRSLWALKWAAAALLALAVAAGLWLLWSARQGATPEQEANKPVGAAVSRAPETAQPQVELAPAARVTAETAPARVEAKAQKGDSVAHAQELAQQGKYNEAIVAYQSALQQEPANDGARQAMVELLLQARRTSEAENALQAGLKYNPQRSTYYMQLAHLQAGRNALPQALDTLMKGLPGAKQQADYQALVASLLQRLGRHASAVVYYRQALALQPNSGEWLMSLGISLQAEQHVAEAREAYRKALATGRLSAQSRDFVEKQLRDTGASAAAGGQTEAGQ